MQLYLVQHAEAQSEDVDPERKITPKGRTDAIRVANMAQKMDVSVTEIRHSGKTRARQTAGILKNYVEPQKGVREAEGLGPVDDVQPIGDQITQDQQDVMLVGHLPFMERLAGYLLTGDADQKVIDFQNAGIVSLALEEGQWIVNWIATPAMFL